MIKIDISKQMLEEIEKAAKKYKTKSQNILKYALEYSNHIKAIENKLLENKIFDLKYPVYKEIRTAEIGIYLRDAKLDEGLYDFIKKEDLIKSINENLFTEESVVNKNLKEVFFDASNLVDDIITVAEENKSLETKDVDFLEGVLEIELFSEKQREEFEESKKINIDERVQ